jgi:hypothetical protein
VEWKEIQCNEDISILVFKIMYPVEESGVTWNLKFSLNYFKFSRISRNNRIPNDRCMFKFGPY